MSYSNPIPHLEGKKFLLKMTFDYDEWTDINDAIRGIESFIKENGISSSYVADITPIEEYK